METTINEICDTAICISVMAVYGVIAWKFIK